MVHPVQSVIESLYAAGRCPRLHVNATHAAVVCPEEIRHQWKERLIIDLDASYPLDLAFGQTGLAANLSFGGTVSRCSFPWDFPACSSTRTTGCSTSASRDGSLWAAQHISLSANPRITVARWYEIRMNGWLFYKLNALGFWLLVPAAVLQLSSFLVAGGAAASGWTAYPPLSLKEFSAGPGQDMWIFGVHFAGVSSILAAINFTNVLDQRYFVGAQNFREIVYTGAPFTAIGSLKFEFH